MIPCHHVALELSQPGAEDKIYQKYKEIADLLKDRNKIIHCELCNLSVPLVWSCFKANCNFTGCGRSQNKHCLQHFNDTEKKPERQSDFEIGTTKYTPGACGLSNLGNTCFMNAAVQALSHTPPFTQLMTRLRPVIDLQTRKSMVHNWCNLLDALWSGTYSSVSPVNLFRDLAEVNPLFRGYAQQDSQECLTTFLNVLHEYLKEESFVDDEAEDLDPVEEKAEPDLQQNNSNIINGSTNTSTASVPINKRRKSSNTMSSSPGSMSPSKASGSPSRRSQFGRDINGSSPRTPSSISSITTSTSTKSSSKQLQSPAEINTEKEIPKERKKAYKSIISDLFEGTLLSRVQCCNCGNVSDTREVFFELSISIPRDSKAHEKVAKRKQIFTEDKTETPKKEGWFGTFANYVGLSNRKVDLVDCLHGYCTTDDLTGTNKYKCDNCKKTSEAKKTFSIFKPPEVLCIHLKRFKHDTLFGTKISDTVAFPLDNLDISPFCVQIDGEDEQKKKDFASKLPFTTNYELVSIVNHRGGYSGGHYVSYCYNRAANKWQEFDDKYVSSVSADDVAGREAYLLFYVKKPTAKQTAQHRLIDQSLREKGSNNLAWIPRVWLERWECMTNPGPLSARSIRCKHGLLARHVASNGLSPRLVAVPRTLLKQFAVMYHPRVVSQQWREYRQRISKKNVADTVTNGSTVHGDGTQSSGAVNINGTSGSKKKDLKSSSGSVSPRKLRKLSRSPGTTSSHINGTKDKDSASHLNTNNSDVNGTSNHHDDSSFMSLDKIDWSYLEIKIDSPICNICQDAQTIQKRRDTEKTQITLLDRQEISDTEAWYLINKPWLDEWRAFVLRGTRPEPPGPIDNTILLQPDGAPKPGLKRGVDYRGVTKEVWDYFVSIYSGGPTITRKRIDIYEPHCTPPEELMLGRK